MMATLLAGGHGPSFTIEGFYAIDFLVFAGLLVYFLRKPIANFITQRRANLTAEIAEAQKLREEAETKLRDYEGRLSSLEDEIAKVMAEARQQAQNERERILAEAQQAADKMTRDAQVRIEQETRKLEYELRVKMVDLSVDMAETMLSTKVDDRVRRRHVEEYISNLESQAGQL